MNIIPFDYAGQEVRTIAKDGEPWFVAKDIAGILGYSNPQKAVRDHCKRPQPVGVNESFTLDPQTIIVPESDLYRLVMRSKLPAAEKFEEWVVGEVLPTIRKTGGAYLTFEKAEQILADPDTIIQLATQIKQLRADSEAKQARIEEMAPKALFADAVSTSETSILVGELAKLLKQNGVEMGQNRLFIWLRDNGYLIRRNGADWNMPTQYSMELGLFEIKERAIANPDGSTRVTKTPKITGKGQLYFVNKLMVSEA